MPLNSMKNRRTFNFAIITATVLGALCFFPSGLLFADDESAPAQDQQQTPPAQTVSAETPAPPSVESPATKPTMSAPAMEDEEDDTQPFEFSPYKILVWIASDDPNLNAASIEAPLRLFLDREYSAIWRLTVADAPTSIASSAKRDLDSLDFESLTASDPIVAIKKNHKDAIRLRVAANVREYISKIYGTQQYIDSVKSRGAEAGDETLTGVAPKLEAVEGDLLSVKEKWADEKTEALLLPRGFAATLSEPDAKIVGLPLSELVGEVMDDYDKIFIVNIASRSFGGSVSVVEFETLMRYFGAVVKEDFVSRSDASNAIGRAVVRAFSPEVRIDEAGLKGAQGLVRASGLILDSDSDALVKPGDMLLPMVRKNDRNGRPILIGPLDWAYLLAIPPQVSAFKDGFRINGTEPVTIPVLANDIDPKGGKKMVTKIHRREAKVGVAISVPQGKATLNKDGTITFKPAEDFEGPTMFSYTMTNGESTARSSVTDNPDVPEAKAAEEPEENPDVPKKVDHTLVKMEFYSGRPGGLQGRANKRTFKRALRIRPTGGETMVRLHAKGKPTSPLIGYELYQKELYGKSMKFVGRTDWDGRLNVEKTDEPLRLLYVKNGGAVLARLPVVPGFTPTEVADLTGDDLRLQAEAFVNGINNSIIDLVAIRKLLASRIRSRLKKGEIEEANKLLLALREQPTKDILAGELDAKEKYFSEVIGVRQANAYRKVKDMFGRSKEMLAEQITQKFIRELEEDYIRAESNGGRLPDDPDAEEEYDASANVVSDEEPKK